ncbi:hypothetical protein RUND412_002680 [Rhizina undulata]
MLKRQLLDVRASVPTCGPMIISIIEIRLQNAEHALTLVAYSILGHEHQSSFDELIFEQRIPAPRAICETLAEFEKALGKDHPSTLKTIGVFFDKQQRHSEAVFSQDHEPTVWTSPSPVRSEQNFGPFQRSLAVKERVLGKDHPETLKTVNYVALVFSSHLVKDGIASARLVLEVVDGDRWRGRRSCCGRDHPSIPDMVHSVALLVFINQERHGRAGQAFEWFERALVRFQMALTGFHFPDGVCEVRDSVGGAPLPYATGEGPPGNLDIVRSIASSNTVMTLRGPRVVSEVAGGNEKLLGKNQT